MAGIRFENPNNTSDTTLRDHAVVAVAVQGDITGDVVAGQVFRIHAFANEELTLGGHISGDVIAHGPNNGVLNTVRAIAYVKGDLGITGNIVALNDATTSDFDPSNPSTYASIGRVVVGPFESADGISGDILAERGKIGTIFTTGPIGRPPEQPRVKITAGNGIFMILATPESNNPNRIGALDRDFDADVLANKLIEDDLEGYPYSGNPALDGTLTAVETGGSFIGSIRAANLNCPPAGGGFCRPTTTAPAHEPASTSGATWWVTSTSDSG